MLTESPPAEAPRQSNALLVAQDVSHLQKHAGVCQLYARRTLVPVQFPNLLLQAILRYNESAEYRRQQSTLLRSGPYLGRPESPHLQLPELRPSKSEPGAEMSTAR